MLQSRQPNMFRMGRQISECSETSVTSTDTPTRTEKRHQAGIS